MTQFNSSKQSAVEQMSRNIRFNLCYHLSMFYHCLALGYRTAVVHMFHYWCYLSHCSDARKWQRKFNLWILAKEKELEAWSHSDCSQLTASCQTTVAGELSTNMLAYQEHAPVSQNSSPTQLGCQLSIDKLGSFVANRTISYRYNSSRYHRLVSHGSFVEQFQ